MIKTILIIVALLCAGCCNTETYETQYSDRIWVTHSYTIDKTLYVKNNEEAVQSYLKQVFELNSEITGPNEIVVEPPLDNPFWNRRRVDLVISMIEAKVTHEVNPRLKIRLRRIGEIAEELRMRRDAAEFEFAESMDKLRRFYDDYEDDFWKVEQ